MSTLTATFEVDSWDEQPFDDNDDGPKVTSAKVTKHYAGDIEGTSATEWVMAYNPDDSATFVGMETIHGTIDGKKGTDGAPTRRTVRERRGDCLAHCAQRYRSARSRQRLGRFQGRPEGQPHRATSADGRGPGPAEPALDAARCRTRPCRRRSPATGPSRSPTGACPLRNVTSTSATWS